MKMAIVLAVIAMTGAGPSGAHRALVRTTSFDRVLASAPTTAGQWNAIGRAFHDAGRYRDAAAAYQRAMQLDRNGSAEAARNVARAYVALGNQKQAQRWLEHARQLSDMNRGDTSSNIVPLRVE